MAEINATNAEGTPWGGLKRIATWAGWWFIGIAFDSLFVLAAGVYASKQASEHGLHIMASVSLVISLIACLSGFVWFGVRLTKLIVMEKCDA